jgi:hypothetical protein
MQHGAHTKKCAQIVEGAGRGRQDGVLVGGKIQRFLKSEFNSSRPALAMASTR